MKAPVKKKKFQETKKNPIGQKVYPLKGMDPVFWEKVKKLSDHYECSIKSLITFLLTNEIERIEKQAKRSKK